MDGVKADKLEGSKHLAGSTSHYILSKKRWRLCELINTGSQSDSRTYIFSDGSDPQHICRWLCFEQSRNSERHGLQRVGGRDGKKNIENGFSAVPLS